MTDPGIHARIAVRPQEECPIRRLSERAAVQQFTPGRIGGNVPQVTLDDDAFAGTDFGFPLTRVVTIGESTVFRLPDVGPVPAEESRAEADEPDASRAGTGTAEESPVEADRPDEEPQPPRCVNYGDGGCLAYGFTFLPVEPYSFRWEDGWLFLSVAALSYEEVQRTLNAFDEWGFDVDLKQVGRCGGADESTNVIVDLDSLTPRQKEVARVAVDMEYFDGNGASAEEVAAELDISKSTVSKHLRAVIRKVLSQVFG